MWDRAQKIMHFMLHRHSIYIRTVPFCLLLNRFKLVYGPFWQNNMCSTLDFCYRPAREETNVPQTIYSRVRNKRTLTFIDFWNFFQGLLSYCGLKRLKFYYISLHILRGYPSFIYSWSIGHILEHEFFCLGHLGCAGSKEKKWIWVFLSNVWGWFFQLFVGKK
jgi:hypothetical protein